MTRLEKALRRLDEDLAALELPWALVGGLAVSAYVEPRPTRDVDVAMAVSSDREAEMIVFSLKGRGYREYPVEPLLEAAATDRLAVVRLLVPGEPEDDEAAVVADLLFATSGTEPEVVAGAERLEIFAGLVVPVVRPGHLLALKVHAGRPRDLEDARGLVRVVSELELELARQMLALIQERGLAAGKDLLGELRALAESRSGMPGRAPAQ